MAVFGSIGIFDENDETFADYADRCDAFIAANGIDDDKQANFFLATVGAATYKLLKDLCRPDKPNTKTYANLKKALSDHFSPKPIIIAERFKFWSASQGPDETISDFIVRLSNLAATCDFHAFREEALRDKLVSGLHSRFARSQKQLLATPNLTFRDAKVKCVADEMAGKAADEHLTHRNSVASENKVYTHNQKRHGKFGFRKSNPNSQSQPRSQPQFTPSPNQKTASYGQCKCCGGTNHRAEVCIHRDAECYKCGKLGHI